MMKKNKDFWNGFTKSAARKPRSAAFSRLLHLIAAGEKYRMKGFSGLSLGKTSVGRRL